MNTAVRPPASAISQEYAYDRENIQRTFTVLVINIAQSFQDFLPLSCSIMQSFLLQRRSTCSSKGSVRLLHSLLMPVLLPFVHCKSRGTSTLSSNALTSALSNVTSNTFTLSVLRWQHPTSMFPLPAPVIQIQTVLVSYFYITQNKLTHGEGAENQILGASPLSVVHSAATSVIS